MREYVISRGLDKNKILRVKDGECELVMTSVNADWSIKTKTEPLDKKEMLNLYEALGTEIRDHWHNNLNVEPGYHHRKNILGG